MTRLRRLSLALVLAAGAMLLVPAAPAQAGGGQEITICYPVGEDDFVVWDCYTVVVPELAADPPFPPPCLTCVPAFHLREQLDPKLEPVYVERLAAGLATLGKAALEKDPDVAEKLRLEATGQFLVSAQILGKSPVELADAGWFDQQAGKLREEPDPQPMKDAGVHMVEGLELMGLAMGDPSPQPNIEAAMAHFDQAYASLAALFGDVK